MMNKTMAKKQNTEMTFDETRPDYIADGERGQENVALEDVQIPRLDVIQDVSPQRKKNDPAYIEGAEEGILFNTVTNELYGEDVYFVPVLFRKEWIIWKGRKDGGGFAGAFPTKEEAEAEFAAQGYEPSDGDGHGYEINDHANHFGLILREGDTFEEIVASMSKSKMKVSRQLNTMVKMAGGDRFSRVYKISAVADQNKNNESYFNLKVQALGYAPEWAYHAGEKMYDAVSSGVKDVVRDAPTKSDKDEPEEF